MGGWSFLTNHARALLCIAADPGARLRDIATSVGITERRAHAIVTDLVDIPDAHLTNLGSKGLGEPPIVPTAAAIANAIRDATGAEVTSLPITREEILQALREARERERVGAGAA